MAEPEQQDFGSGLDFGALISSEYIDTVGLVAERASSVCETCAGCCQKFCFGTTGWRNCREVAGPGSSGRTLLKQVGVVM